jgi:hypothetical protein
MSQRVRNWALAGWASFTVGVLALHVVWPQPGQEVGYWPWAVGLMAFPVAAALILAKLPGNGVGRVLGVVGMATLAIFFPWWYAVNYLDSPLSRLAEVLSDVAVVPQFGGMIALMYLFPTGRPLNVRHARVFTVFGWFLAGVAVLGLLRPGPLWATGRPNPLGVAPDWTVPVWDVGFVALLVFGLLGIGSLVVRWRIAGPIERSQLRWVLAAAAAAMVMLALVNVVPDSGNRLEDTIAGVFIAATAFWSLPAAIVIAITRYRLYEIDRLISRTATYALVVGMSGAVYAGGVFLLRGLLPLEGDLAIAASTLAVAALFNPLRKRVQDRVDRRFNRPRYNAQLEVERFAGCLRTDLDLDDLTNDLLGVVVKTVQPSTASMWIRGHRQ